MTTDLTTGPTTADALAPVVVTDPLGHPASATPVAVLDLVVPVFNEQDDLERCVRRLHSYLSDSFPFPFAVTIADNASTDATLVIARRLAVELPGVRVLHLEAKGRGRALHAAWTASSSPVLAYCDVDLSTDLAALLPLVAPLISGHSDVAIGTRLSSSSQVSRGAKREVISRCYNLLLRSTLAVRFTDAQCGFKALRADVAAQLLPLVEDTGWFFDTELLVLAQAAGMRIHEVPVDWVDDPDSRVDIVSTARADLRGMWRVGWALSGDRLALPTARPRRPPDRPRPHWQVLTGQIARFCLVGGVSTAAYLLLFLLLNPVVQAQAANALALLITAVGNTAANRRITFGVRGPRDAVRHQVQGLGVFVLGLALTSGSLAALHVLSPGAPAVTELGVLVAANLAATLLRFVLFRGWVFSAARPATTTVSATAATHRENDR